MCVFVRALAHARACEYAWAHVRVGLSICVSLCACRLIFNSRYGKLNAFKIRDFSFNDFYLKNRLMFKMIFYLKCSVFFKKKDNLMIL